MNNSGRSYYDPTRYCEDDVNFKLMILIKFLQYNKNYKFIVLTGRMASSEGAKQTLKWIEDNKLYPDGIYMRKDNDYRKDYHVKSDLIKEVEEKYEICYAFDDSKTSCKAYRDAGITCLQVAYDPGRIRKCCKEEKGNYCSTCGADLKYGRQYS